MSKSALEELVGEDLSGVTFVRDYLQFEFNPPPTLNAYTPVTIRVGDRMAKFGDESFANLAIGQINKVVRSATIEPKVALRIVFEDSSAIEISLRDEDYVGPEAINFFSRNGTIVVE